MAKDKQKAQSEQLALQMAKPLYLRNMLHESKSPVPTSELVSSLQPKAGPSRASQVFFKPPTPALPPTVMMTWMLPMLQTPIPQSPSLPTPPLPQDRTAVMAGVDQDTFMGDFEDLEAFFTSSAKDKVLDYHQAATKSTHNLVETLNLWSSNSYRLQPLTCLSPSSYRQSTQSLKLALSSMPWLLDLRLKSLLSAPSLRASVCRPLQLLPPHHNHNLPDLGLCPAPPMPPLTLPASVAQSRRPSLCTLTSTLFPPTPSPLPQWLLLLLLSPSPLPPRRGTSATAAQAGLVEMAKSFPSAATATIVYTQQVVSRVASVAPSNSERAKACCKRSTTHGPHKEVVVITSLPTHWPERLVVGLLNSYLGSHGRAIRAITKTQNHLGGLALMCDVLLVENNIQVMHAYFNTATKRIHEDNTTKTQVEVGLFKSFPLHP
jgi:hypothetical protein